MNTDRIELEQAIIGAVVLETRYDQVSSILRRINFESKEHQAIWGGIQHLAGNYRPYDMITLTRHLHQHAGRPGYNWAQEIADCTARVCDGESLIAHAFSLLEQDIKHKYLKLLRLWVQHHQNDLDYCAVMQLIINQFTQPQNDIFIVMRKAANVFKASQLEDEAQATEELLNNIDMKADHIKDLGEFQLLISRLKRLCQRTSIGLTAEQQEKVLQLINTFNNTILT